MAAPILATKVYIPSPGTRIVQRPRLIETLNEGLSARLTLISAPAGFGKTTLVSEWIAESQMQVAWLSLDEGDSDQARFIAYLVAALQTIRVGIGEGLLAALQSPYPLQIETVLTTLINEINAIPEHFLLILDDYHTVDSQQVDQSLTFIIQHMPSQMHLVIATREDPQLPLARYRARGQLNELRAADLRFTPIEAAEFLNRITGLTLSPEDIAALETRTEGWIAGLQMAAISMKANKDAADFIQTFTGSHRFVMDYLVEEVLHQQDESHQVFLLRTSILDRMCGPLCDVLMVAPIGTGQVILEDLERTNLFIVPQDNERHWYRYHHLFGDLLLKRLGQSLTSDEIAELHIRASQWFEDNEMMLDAFRHAAAANDVERASRLVESQKMPIHRRGVATTILGWLGSLPKSLLDSKPWLLWKQAALLLVIGQPMGVEEKLQQIEAVLGPAARSGNELGGADRDLIGKIATARANLAQTQVQAESIFVQAQRALEFLDPNSLSDRSVATRSLGFAYYLQNDMVKAGVTYKEALSLAHAAGDHINTVLALIRVGQIQEQDAQLRMAAETYRQVLQVIDEYSPSNAPVAYLGLARISYEWNDLTSAEQLGEQSLLLARQYDQVVDRLVLSQVFQVALRLARGDVTGAEQFLSQAAQTARQKNYTFREIDMVAHQAWIHHQQGNHLAALQLARQHELPLMQARILIALNESGEALAIAQQQRTEAEANGWISRLLTVMAVQACALYALGDKEQAREVVSKLLALAEPEGCIRLFVDEGAPMRALLKDFRLAIEVEPHTSNHSLGGYVDKLLRAFSESEETSPLIKIVDPQSKMVEPLSERELEVLRLLRSELNGPEIAGQLVVSLNTLRTHTKNIYGKLGVNNRRAAVRRAEELELF